MRILPEDLTRILHAWSDGDGSAPQRLVPIVYDELRRIALRNLAGERKGHPLQPSALVNEAFVRLLGKTTQHWADRTHFFAFSARLMRQILVDFARMQDAEKRGGRVPHESISVADVFAAKSPDPVDLIDLDSALEQLAELDPRQASLVELRYFGGLNNLEIADVLGISEPTVVREWRIARLWLFDRLNSKTV